MLCIYCGGKDTVAERKVRFGICEVPKPFIIENLPAFVCSRCGDMGFSGKTTEKWEKIDKGEVQPVRIQTLPVFDFNNLWGKVEETDSSRKITNATGD